MSQTTTPPIITFHGDVTTKASPQAVYDVLADLRTHGLDAGSKARRAAPRAVRAPLPDRALGRWSRGPLHVPGVAAELRALLAQARHAPHDPPDGRIDDAQEPEGPRRHRRVESPAAD